MGFFLDDDFAGFSFTVAGIECRILGSNQRLSGFFTRCKGGAGKN